MNSAFTSLPASWTILLVEDDVHARHVAEQGIRHFLSQQGFELQALHLAHNCREAERISSQLTELHLVVLDLGLPDGWGHELIPQLLLRFPSLPIIVHTVFDDDANLFLTLERGAQGYILKGADERLFSLLLSDIVQGRPPLSPAIARRLLQHFRTQTPPQSSPLTPKELEVTQHLARGLTNIEVAQCLGISPHTVATHIKNIYKKLQVTSRAEMTSLVQKRGWISS